MTQAGSGVLAPNPYERLYRSQAEGLLWGPDPGRLVAGLDRWMDLDQPGTVLDAGCGDGKNSLYLERQGFQVLGVDQSHTALAALRRRAARTSQLVQGRYVAADIEDFAADETFDVVVSYGLYHCLDRDRRVAVHRRLQGQVKPGGIVLFTCLIDSVPLAADHFDVQVWLPSESEIMHLFEGGTYNIEHWEVGSIVESHLPLVSVHEHQAVWAVARRSS